MDKTIYLDVELLIERAEVELATRFALPSACPYDVRVLNSPAGLASGSFRLPFSEAEWSAFLGGSYPTVNGAKSELMDMLYGERLFAALFRDEVGECLQATLQHAREQSAGLRLRLRFKDVPELIHLPWECLPILDDAPRKPGEPPHKRGEPRFLLPSSPILLIRHVETASPPLTPPNTRGGTSNKVPPLVLGGVRGGLPLRILVMVADCYAASHSEWDKVQLALSRLQEDELLMVEGVAFGTLAALQDVLQQATQEYHVLHFVGNGWFDAANQASGLVLAASDQEVNHEMVSSNVLGALLSDHPSLRLVVFNPCGQMGLALTDCKQFIATAHELVQQGISSTIVMPSVANDQIAIRRMREFYKRLAQGDAVDVALAKAHHVASQQVGDHRSKTNGVFSSKLASSPQMIEQSPRAALLTQHRPALTLRHFGKLSASQAQGTAAPNTRGGIDAPTIERVGAEFKVPSHRTLACGVLGGTPLEGGRGVLGGLPAPNRPLLFTRMSDNHLFELPSEVMTESNEAEINTVVPPYKGLRYFEEQDAERFFGREELTAQLVEHLSASPFLALIGASGSGKSSLLRAGLLPALSQKEVAPASVRLITPTAHPLEALASILTPHGTNNPSLSDFAGQVSHSDPSLSHSERNEESLVELMTQNPRTLALYADQLICQSEAGHASAMLRSDTCPTNTQARSLAMLRRDASATSATMAPLPLLVVDQFEELFTLCHNPVAREAFVDNLMAAVASNRMMVVIALRSDYYAQCVQFDQLRQLLERQQKLIGPLSGHQWRRAIQEPARQGGWELEEGLLETLLQGGRTEADALPRLSHALLETWQRREGQTLTFAGYAAAGGMEGAIDQSAEHVFKQFALKERAITRSIFLRLTKVGGHAPSESVSRDSTRRATLTELLQSGRRHDAPIVEEVINTLADAGLITIHHAISPEPRIARETSSPSPSIGRGGRGVRALDRSPSPSIGRGGRGVRALDRSPSPSIGRGGRGVRALDRSPSPSIGRGGRGVRAVTRFWGSDAQFFEQRPDGQAATVEIAHDALIHHWPRLGEWLDEKRDQWRVESRLTQPARLWELNNRDPRYLYRGARLAEAEIVSDLLYLDGLKREFLEASLTQQEQEAQKGGFSMEKEPRRPIPSSEGGQPFDPSTSSGHRKLRAPRRGMVPTKWVGGLAIIGLLIMCGLVVASFVFARQQWQRAEQLQQASQASELAAQAQAVRDQHPQRSLLLALEALSVSKQAEQPPLPAALQALRDALDHSGGFDLGGHASGIHVVGLTPNVYVGLTPNVYNEAPPYWLVTGYGDGRVGLWDLTERRAEPALYGERAPTMELVGHQDRITAMINYHPWLITGSRDGTIRLWDMSLANPMANSIPLQGHKNQIETLAIAHHWLVSDSHDNTVRLWDLREPSRAPILLVSHQDYIDSALLPNANGEMRPYAITADAYKIFLWDLTADDPSLQAAIPLGTHADRMGAIALSADKRWLVTGSNDSSVRLWDLSKPLPTGGNPEPTYLQAHNNQIKVVAVTSDNRWVLTTGGQDAFLWDLSSPEIATQPIHLPGHKDEIKKAIISPDNHWLITASSRTAFLWDLHKMPVEGRQPVELRSPQDRISALAVSPDSRWLVIGSYDHSAYLWDLNALGASPYRLQGHDDPIESLMISAAELPSPPAPLPILGEGSTEGEESAEGEPSPPTPLPILGEGSTEGEGSMAHGAWLVTRSRNGSARLWDLREPVERQLTYLADQKQESGASSIPTAANQWMVSNQDNPPSISKLSLEQLSELACYTAARNFTQAEWVQYFPEQRFAYRQTCPNLPVHPSVIETLLAEGQVLAKESQIEDAIAKFEQAIALDPDLADLLYQAPLEPETEARRLAAETLIEEGERLAHKGEVNDALAAYDKAQEIYPQIDISGPSWNTLCRFGAPWGYPKEVMHACENAVQQDPDNGLAHNSRALARALTGDHTGAIEDYQLFIQWSQETGKYEHYIPLRQKWIDALQAGEDPFDDETRMKLRYE